jgi:hypothetical protein
MQGYVLAGKPCQLRMARRLDLPDMIEQRANFGCDWSADPPSKFGEIMKDLS